MALRGTNRMDAVKVLQDAEQGDGILRQPCLQIAAGKWLRVVRGYKHLGAMATATQRFNPEVVARVASESGVEVALERALDAEHLLPDWAWPCCGAREAESAFSAGLLRPAS